MRFEGLEEKNNDGKKYGACTEHMEYDYSHNGTWGIGDTVTEAVMDAYKNAK